MSFDDFFGMLIGETIENTILNTAIENSLQSYNEDLFKKDDIIDMPSERMKKSNAQKNLLHLFRSVSTAMCDLQITLRTLFSCHVWTKRLPISTITVQHASPK